MKIGAILRLTRIEHSIILVIAVLAAELIAKGLPSLPVLVLSLITPIFISMAAFAINDYFDFKVDKVNRKERPIVTGAIKKVEALYITAVSLLIGIVASLFINFYAFGIAVIFGALALLYSYKLKGIPIVGNAYIGFSMAIPFIFGSYVVNQTLGTNIMLVAAMIFISGVAREIHGTIRDLKGDAKARNLNTLPRIIGVRSSALAALLLYIVAILISIYLFLLIKPFKGNLIYGGLIGLSDILLLYTAVGYLSRQKEKFYKDARNISLGAMTLAVITILIAPL